MHNVIDDVSMSWSRSNFEIVISPSIFQLQRQSIFREVKGQRHRLTGWPWDSNGRNGWNNNWNVRNNHSYVATATKIWFHFQFPRPHDAAFGGGRLLNLKFTFGCRIISIIANHVKCNCFWVDDGIDMSRSRLWKFSNCCPGRTVGVVGYDIMYHTLVCYSKRIPFQKKHMEFQLIVKDSIPFLSIRWCHHIWNDQNKNIPARYVTG